MNSAAGGAPLPPMGRGAHDWKTMLGPIRAFMEDATVTEVMCNGPSKIFIEQKGLIKRTPAKFDNPEQLIKLMTAMAAMVGRKLDPITNPCVDARLPDGSRINLVIPPVAIDGPSLTIRKFFPYSLTHTHLIQGGMMDEKLAFFLHCCVAARLNLIVSGGTGSGKTTMLNVLSSFIPPHERIVTIEDAAELKIQNENTVRLETQPTPEDGRETVNTRKLVINALRMRPDRIIVGECRGSEALDMLMAMNTGHDGSMTTVHANSARDALRRLESMILMAGTEMPLKVIRHNLSGALNLIVQVNRGNDGVRRVTEILEVGGMESDVILTQDLFRYVPGQGHRALGFVPQFVRLFKERGVDFPPDFFNDVYNVKSSGPKKA